MLSLTVGPTKYLVGPLDHNQKEMGIETYECINEIEEELV